MKTDYGDLRDYTSQVNIEIINRKGKMTSASTELWTSDHLRRMGVKKAPIIIETEACPVYEFRFPEGIVKFYVYDIRNQYNAYIGRLASQKCTRKKWPRELRWGTFFPQESEAWAAYKKSNS